MKYVLLLTILVFLAACTTPVVEEEIPVNPAPEETVEIEEPVEEEVIVEEPEQELGGHEIFREEPLANYQYSFEGRARDSFGNFDSFPLYDVFVKDNKIKKVYRNPERIENTFYNEVYLDTDAETAVALCTAKGGVVCDPFVDSIITLEYGTEVLDVTPITVMNIVPNDAAEEGTERLLNRDATLLEFGTETGSETVYVDDFYKIPLQWEIYVMEDDESVLQSEYTFDSPKINSVKNADVDPPEGLEVLAP